VDDETRNHDDLTANIVHLRHNIAGGILDLVSNRQSSISLGTVFLDSGAEQLDFAAARTSQDCRSSKNI
jgi:hypothetical protein